MRAIRERNCSQSPRGRVSSAANGVGGAQTKISEHAKGNALDITGFGLSDNRSIQIMSELVKSEQLALKALRTSACGYFTTVLGPGANPAHKHHFHFDFIKTRQVIQLPHMRVKADADFGFDLSRQSSDVTVWHVRLALVDDAFASRYSAWRVRKYLGEDWIGTGDQFFVAFSGSYQQYVCGCRVPDRFLRSHWIRRSDQVNWGSPVAYDDPNVCVASVFYASGRQILETPGSDRNLAHASLDRSDRNAAG